MWLTDICTRHTGLVLGLFLWIKQDTWESLKNVLFCILVVVIRLIVSSVRLSLCFSFLHVLQRWLCAAVFPAISSRCFTSLFLHLHPLPTHLPQKGLPMLLFSIYLILLFSLTLFFSKSENVLCTVDKILWLYSLFHLFSGQFKESVACDVIYGGWMDIIIFFTEQETAVLPSKII